MRGGLVMGMRRAQSIFGSFTTTVSPCKLETARGQQRELLENLAALRTSCDIQMQSHCATQSFEHPPFGNFQNIRLKRQTVQCRL